MNEGERQLEKLRATCGSLFKVMAIMREEFPLLEMIWEEAQAGSREAMNSPKWAHFDEFALARSDVLFYSNLLAELGLGVYAKYVVTLSPLMKDEGSEQLRNQIKVATEALTPKS